MFMLLNYALPSLLSSPLPLSHRDISKLLPTRTRTQLTSGKKQVAERRSGKIRGGGVALGCAVRYFDHCFAVSANFIADFCETTSEPR